MGAPVDAYRRLRRWPGARFATWAALILLAFYYFPTLRAGVKKGGHFPIRFTDLDEDTIPQCSQIPQKELARLQASGQMAVHTYRAGAHLLEAQEVNEAVALCVIAVMPQTITKYGYFKDVPIAGKGPDSIHLYLNSSSVLVTTPPMLPLPSQPSAQMQLADESVLYYTELKLKDPGVYQISAEREFANWRWAKQWVADMGNDTITFLTGHMAHVHNYTEADQQMEKLKEVNEIVNDGSLFNAQPLDPSNIHPRTITVDFNIHPDLPGAEKRRCTSLPYFSATKGRWYNATDFPSMPNRLADEWGFIYAPDECELDFFSGADLSNCLQDKVIHVFGDSNARRLSRSIMSGGRWCHDPANKCQKEDWGDDVLKLEWNELFGQLMEETESPEHNGQFELNDRKPFKFGRNARLSFNFLQSIAFVPSDWLSAFYDPKDFHLAVQDPNKMTAFDPYQIKPDAKGRPPPDQPNADLVIIAIGAWDEAFDQTFADFERTTPYFRNAILEAYSDSKTKIALRLSQGHCCRRDWGEDLRRFSGMRIQHFGDIMRETFEVEHGQAMGGRMHVIDASGMSGRPEVVNDYGGVGSNHQRAAHSRLEAQILLNKICERDHSGKAVWRSDSTEDNAG